MVSHSHPPITVLAAEDSATTRSILRRVLEEEGYRVRLVRDGEECLREVIDQPPDVILCDNIMPGLAGTAVCKILKSSEKTRHIPFFLISARMDRNLRLRALEEGADAAFHKPLPIAEFNARATALVRFKRLDDEVRRQRQVIDNLLMISTMCQGYANASTRMFWDFGRRTADLLHARQVAVIVERRGSPPSVLACWPTQTSAQIHEEICESPAVGRVLSTGSPLTVGANEVNSQRALGITEGFVGVPMLNFEGRVIGAVVAFGTPDMLNPDSVRILLALAGRVGAEIQLRDHSEQLEGLVAERTHDLSVANVALESAQEETIFRLALAAEFRDDDTGNHLRRIGQFSEMLGHAVGLPGATVELLRHASLMHDIGKIAIPDHILRKTGTLTEEEAETMRLHTVFGAQICQGSSAPLLQMSERIAIAHHERWDGTGYPHRISGEQIPVEARIVSVVDIFDALISERPYKRAWDPQEAFEHLRSIGGNHLEQRLVDAFLDMRGTVEEIAGRLREEKRARAEPAAESAPAVCA